MSELIERGKLVKKKYPNEWKYLNFGEDEYRIMDREIKLLETISELKDRDLDKEKDLFYSMDPSDTKKIAEISNLSEASKKVFATEFIYEMIPVLVPNDEWEEMHYKDIKGWNKEKFEYMLGMLIYKAKFNPEYFINIPEDEYVWLAGVVSTRQFDHDDYEEVYDEIKNDYTNYDEINDRIIEIIKKLRKIVGLAKLSKYKEDEKDMNSSAKKHIESREMSSLISDFLGPDFGFNSHKMKYSRKSRKRRCSRGRKKHSPRRGSCRRRPGPKRSRRKSRKPSRKRKCSRGRKKRSPRKGSCRRRPGPKKRSRR
jgi:hypothetical protein